MRRLAALRGNIGAGTPLWTITSRRGEMPALMAILRSWSETQMMRLFRPERSRSRLLASIRLRAGLPSVKDQPWAVKMHGTPMWAATTFDRMPATLECPQIKSGLIRWIRRFSSSRDFKFLTGSRVFLSVATGW